MLLKYNIFDNYHRPRNDFNGKYDVLTYIRYFLYNYIQQFKRVK